jgi:hypothetical protein
MAQVKHLPIYREAMKLAVLLESVVRGFSRYTKYTLGSELRRLANWSNDHTNLAWQCRTLAARFPDAVLFVQLDWAYLLVESGRDQRQSSQRFGPRRVVNDGDKLLSGERQVVMVKETGRRFGRLCEWLPATIAKPCPNVAA